MPCGSGWPPTAGVVEAGAMPIPGSVPFPELGSLERGQFLWPFQQQFLRPGCQEPCSRGSSH